MPSCHCRVCKSDNPRNKRLRTAAAVSVNGKDWLMIDTSSDFRQQVLTNGIESILGVLFTHSHADHILGLDDLRGFYISQRRPIPCYGSEATLEELRRIFRYIFETNPDYEGGPLAQLAATAINDTEIVQCGGIEAQAFPLWHGKMPVLGYRFGDIAYATDCNRIPEESQKILRGVKHLVLDGLRNEPHRTHFTIPDAIKAAESLHAENVYLTHMTHSVDYDEVSAQLPKNVKLAYDGLEIA